MAATVLPLKLSTVGDPMSGIFMVRASALKDADLDPVGYKILLEVLAKAHYQKVVEVPYIFQERRRGNSKLGARQYLEFLLHLGRLAAGTGQLRSWIRYGLVALLGALIDIGLFYVLVQYGAWPPVAALALAIEVALLSNFFCNEAFTFRPADTPRFREGALGRLLRYEAVCLPGAILNMLVTLFWLSRGGGVLTAAALGVPAGGLFNIVLNIPAIWRTWGKQAPPEPSPDPLVKAGNA
jgi:dolichol-phosphate mannosyltransferase